MKIIGVIPARYNSTRFPGKPLALIDGKPMIQWVYESAVSCNQLSNVYVATDDYRIAETVKKFGGEVIMTPDCKCGTDRVYHATKNIDCDIVINIQGDEPLINKTAIIDIISAFLDNTVNIAILKKKINKESSEITDPNVCKVVTDRFGNAIYFSRYPIPFDRDSSTGIDYYKALGVYGYRKDFLMKFANMPVGYVENAEKLEPIRVLENGYKIRVIETEYDGIGVDLPEHIKKIESALRSRLND